MSIHYMHAIPPSSGGYHLDIPQTVWTDDWYGTCAKASICEYLVKNGVEVIV